MGLTTTLPATRRQFITGLITTAGVGLGWPALADDANEDLRLMALLREDALREDALEPMAPVYRGDAPNLMAFRQLYTDQRIRAQRASAQQSLKALTRINRARLSPERQISYDAFLLTKRDVAQWLRPDMVALTEVRPINHLAGWHIDFPSLIAKGGVARYESELDYRNNLALLETFPEVLDNIVARFRQGLASGIIESRLTTASLIAQVDELISVEPAESLFTSPVREFPASVSTRVRDALRSRYFGAAANGIYPAYRRLRDFLEGEYLPAAREAVGLAAMKGGDAVYAQAITRHTNLRLDPESVHQLGLREVARIQDNMEGVCAALGFKGTLRTFFEEVRINPRYHPKSAAQLAKAFADAARAVDAQIPNFFSKVPQARLAIKPYPGFRDKYEAGGAYHQGSPNGSHPGVFYYNTYDLPSRFLTSVVTLYMHEGMPGHHFQISRALEDTSLPDFQRQGGSTAFSEGWALYAETLGYEMGLYKDPLQHWGTLDDEMLRAMRLVVDTGIHAKGWSREAAIDYMLANSGMGRSDAAAEVERYIVWPGQALSYKIGGLTIQRLRREAENKLGKRFDIKVFHEQVLGSGGLPLPVLEAKIAHWIVAQSGQIQA